MCNCIFVGVTAKKNLITAFLKICSFLAKGLPQDVGNSDVFPWWQGRHVSKTQPRYHFASYTAIMCPLMVLKGMVAAVVLDVLSVLTLVL